MSRSEQIRLDVTAKDKASKVLAGVADEAERLEESDPTVTVDANAKDALRTLDTVERATEELTDADRILVLRAKADALKAELREVSGDLDALERTNPTVTIDADTGPARRKLTDLEGERPGKAVGEQFVRDVGGAFGGSAWTNTAADAVAAFETLGETLGGTAAGKVVGGIGAKLIPAVAVAGVLGSAVVALWQLFRTEGDKAVDDAVEKMRGAFDTFADTYKREKLREAITEALTPDQAALLSRFGIFLDDLVGLVEGKPIKATETLEAAFRKAIGVLGPGGLIGPAELKVATLEDALGLTRAEAQKLYDAASKYREIEGILDTSSGAVGRLRREFRDTQAFVQGGTADVETFGRTVRGLPLERAVAIYPDLDEAGNTRTEAELDHTARDRTSTVRVSASLDETMRRVLSLSWLPWGWGAGSRAAAPSSSSPATFAAAAPAPAAMPRTVTVRVEGAGVVTDPVRLGRQLGRSLGTYQRVNGRPPQPW